MDCGKAAAAAWHWVIDYIDKYDDDGNQYTYYVVETSPTEASRWPVRNLNCTSWRTGTARENIIRYIRE